MSLSRERPLSQLITKLARTAEQLDLVGGLDAMGYIPAPTVNRQLGDIAEQLQAWVDAARPHVLAAERVQAERDAFVEALAHIAALMHGNIQYHGGVKAALCDGAIARSVTHWQRLLLTIVANSVAYVAKDLDHDEAGADSRQWVIETLNEWADRGEASAPHFGTISPDTLALVAKVTGGEIRSTEYSAHLDEDVPVRLMEEQET